MTKSFFGLLCLLLTFAATLVAEEKAPPLKIGFIAPLSGPAAGYGSAARNGLELALEDLPRGRLSVVYEDDQYSAQKTVSAFRKLTTEDKVDVVLAMSSTTSNAIAPLAESSKVPLIVWANDPKIARNRRYVILAETPATIEGQKTAREAKRIGYSKLALIRAEGDYQTALIEGFRAHYSASGIQMLEEVSSKETDFRPFLLKLHNKPVDAIGMCLHPGQFGILAKQSRELGMSVPFFGCNSMQDASELTTSGGALERAWFVSVAVSPDFRQRYVKRFGNDSVLSGAAVYYEIAKLLAELKPTTALEHEIIANSPRLGAIGKFDFIENEGTKFMEVDMKVMMVTKEGLKQVDPAA